MSMFSERLRELRGVTSQTEFASAMGMKYQQYARYESGASSPSVDILLLICKVHSADANWLLGLDRPSAKTLQVNGSGNAVATGPGARATVQADATPASCRTCPYRRKLAKLEKLICGK